MSANPDAIFKRGLTDRRRPPIVHFFRRARFDQAATNKAGRSVYVDEDVVTITSPDGGVTLDRVVSVWFDEMRNAPQDWGAWEHGFRQMFKDWKDTIDTVNVQGTHISNWPLISPAQVQMLLNAGIKTIEQTADMPDNIATMIEGGNYVRTKARAWINSANDLGATAAEIAKLTAENTSLRADVELKAGKIEFQRKEIERLTLFVTGKEGFDTIAGRIQPVPLHAVPAAAQPPTTPVPAEQLPEAARLSYEAALALSVMDLRTLCYEHNIKPPNGSAAEIVQALVSAGEVAPKPFSMPPAAEDTGPPEGDGNAPLGEPRRARRRT